MSKTSDDHMTDDTIETTKDEMRADMEREDKFEKLAPRRYVDRKHAQYAKYRRKYRARRLIEMTANPDDRAHGTRNGYAIGCRCERCRQAKSKYNRDYRLAHPERYAMPIHREFTCRMCGELVVVNDNHDRRSVFCSQKCEKRWWRHADRYERRKNTESGHVIHEWQLKERDEYAI